MSSCLPRLLLEYISLNHSSARISAVSQTILFLWLYSLPKIPWNLLNAVNRNMFRRILECLILERFLASTTMCLI